MRYSTVVYSNPDSIKTPQLHHTIPSEVLSKDSEALFTKREGVSRQYGGFVKCGVCGGWGILG